MCKLIRRIIPGKEPERIEINIDDLDANISDRLPSAAIGASTKAIMKMSEVVRQDVQETKTFFNKHGNAEDKDVLTQSESLINNFDKKLTDYLVSIQTNSSLTPDDMEDVRLNLEVIKNLERMGGTFTNEAVTDVNRMFDMFLHMYSRCLEIYRTHDRTLYASLMQDEEAIDKLEFTSRQEHFVRMSKQQCSSAIAASVYCDILGNLERMGDHCCNIARAAIEDSEKAAAAQIANH